MYDIGIVAAAGNPHGDAYFDMQIRGFEECAKLWPHDKYKIKLHIVSGTDGQPSDTFTKGIAINQGIREIHKECDFIACTDIDLLIPPAAFHAAMDFHRGEGANQMMSQLSRQLFHWNGELNFDEDGNWVNHSEFEQAPVRFECIGAWMSMRADMWIRCGGFSEEYVGWGSDDHEVKERAILHGMEFNVHESMIMHLAHPARNYQSRANTKRNDMIRFDPARKVRNFMGQTREPDFVIAGAQKCGTTALSYMIDKNQDVYMPHMSPHPFEIHHFDKPENYNRGDDFYFSWFPSSFPSDMGQPMLVGEKTPNYTADIETIERMHATIPNTKIVMILRDPVDRAYSTLNHMHRRRIRWPDFDVMFGNRIDHELHRQIIDLWGYGDKPNPIFDWGEYYPRVKRLHELYGDKLLVLKYTDLNVEPLGTVNKMCGHIGASPMLAEQIEVGRVNTTGYVFPIIEKDRVMLDAHYRPFNEQLFDLLGWESY